MATGSKKIRNFFTPVGAFFYALLIFSFVVVALHVDRLLGVNDIFPRLVTTGPYAYVRNPMLTGIFALLFGFGVSLGSVSLMVVFTPFFILINVWELKVIEEPELVKRLGEDYIEYRKRTPMFFPHLRRNQ